MLYLIVTNNNTYLESIKTKENIVEEVVFTPIKSDALREPEFILKKYIEPLHQMGYKVHLEEWKR